MAPEKTEPEKDTPITETPGEPEKGQSLTARTNEVLLNPYRLTVAFIIVGAIVGLGQIITDYNGFPGDGTGQTKGILNDLFNIVAAGGFLIGLLALAKAIRIYQGREQRTAPETLKDKALDPIWVIEFYPYLLAFVSLLHAVFFILDFKDSSTQWVLTVAFGQMWLTAFTVFIVISFRLGVQWLINANGAALVPGSAPSGAQENASGSKSESVEATPEPDADTATDDDSNDESSSGPKGWTWLSETLEDPDRLLTLGAYMIAYTGMLSQVFMVWVLRDFSEGQLWAFSVEMLAGIVAGVGVILIVRTILRTLKGRTEREGELGREDGENVFSWIERLMNNPMRGPLLILGVSWALGVIYYLALVWDARNVNPSAFWSTILPANMIGTIVTASLLSVWAIIFHMSKTKGDSVAAMQRAATGFFFQDPVRILRIAAYSVAYMGLVFSATLVFDHRNNDGWQVWYYFFNGLGRTIVIAGVIVGLRAVFQELKGAPATAIE